MSSTLPQHPTVPKGTDIPEPVGKMAYASDDSQLFIQGGSYGSENKISSAFSLNLTSDWSVEDPAWSRLELIENFYGQSGVMNLGRFIAFETGNNQINVSIYSKHWERLNLSPSFNTPDPVIVSRQDGMVYFLGKKGEALFMDTKNWTFSNFKSPTFDTFEPTGQSASWSAYKESILIPIFNDTDVDVHMYNTSSHISRPLNTAKNLKITPRTGYCFVPCNDGKQYYLFGGRNDTAVFDDLYLLDLEENTWTQLDNSRSSRSMMACAVREKTLVVWGGFLDTDSTAVSDNKPLVFNGIEWVTKYTVTGSSGIPTRPFPSPVIPSTPSSSNGINVGIIVGGVIGGVALIALVAGLLFYLRRQRHRSAGGSKTTVKKSTLNDESGLRTLELGGYTTIPSPFISDETYNPQQMTPYAAPHVSGPLPMIEHVAASRAQQQQISPVLSRPIDTLYQRDQSQMSQTSGISYASIIQSPFEVEPPVGPQHPLLQQSRHLPSHQNSPTGYPLQPISQLPASSNSYAGPLGYGGQDGNYDERVAIMPRSMEPATVDLIPISASEAGDDEGSQASRSNSIVSSRLPESAVQSAPTRIKSHKVNNVEAAGNRGDDNWPNNNLSGPEDSRRDSSESLTYLDIE